MSQSNASNASALNSPRNPPRNRHANGGQGMNWIRAEKRLAIYLRDGLACCYCGHAIEDGAKLTLDHLMPHSAGGTNEPANLATCCHRCNSSRGNRSWMKFAATVAAYLNHDVQASSIIAHIRSTARRPIDVTRAKGLIAAALDACGVPAACPDPVLCVNSECPCEDSTVDCIPPAIYRTWKAFTLPEGSTVEFHRVRNCLRTDGEPDYDNDLLARYRETAGPTEYHAVVTISSGPFQFTRRIKLEGK